MAFTNNLIVAYSAHDYGIGSHGKLPWNLPKELKRFRDITTNTGYSNIHDISIEYINVIVMGRKTWESMGRRILPNRINLVVTNNDVDFNSNYDDPKFPLFSCWDLYEEELGNYLLYTNKKRAIPLVIAKIFIIGGASIYRLALETKYIDTIYTTEIYDKTISSDVFYPMELQNAKKYKLTAISAFQLEANTYYRYCEYKNADLPNIAWENKEELAYLEVMRHIYTRGIIRIDRTGTGTKSSFGHQLRYDLRDTFPLTTTKSSFLRGVFEELMLYLRGQTDNGILQTKKIHIWDGNTSRTFLDKRGLTTLPEGDMGETYGFNMRHYGGEYRDCKTEYGPGVGYDQLANIIELLKTEPTSRRIIINLWNPATQHKAALPSCLCQYQFWVNTEINELSLQIYIRSSDYFLANNWNTCTGALFVHLLCNTPGLNHLRPGELIVTTGDTHIYLTHLEQVKINLERKPYPFPKLVVGVIKPITEFQWEDISLVGYRSHPKITADMAI